MKTKMKIKQKRKSEDFEVHYNGDRVGTTLYEAYQYIGLYKVKLTQVHLHVLDESGAGVNQIMEALHQITLLERGENSSQLVAGLTPKQRDGVFVIPALAANYDQNIPENAFSKAVDLLAKALFEGFKHQQGLMIFQNALSMYNYLWPYSVGHISKLRTLYGTKIALHNHDPRIEGLSEDKAENCIPCLNRPGNYLFCNSEERKQEMLKFLSSYSNLKHYLYNPQAIRVIPSGVFPKFYFNPMPLPSHIKDIVINSSPLRTSDQLTWEVFGNPGSNEIRILISCPIREHKNPYYGMEFVAQIAKIAPIPIRLIITGMPDPIVRSEDLSYAQQIKRQAKLLQQQIHSLTIIILDGILQQYLPALYTHIHVLLYPSIPTRIVNTEKNTSSPSEGFGMPPVEAAICKKLCVVTRNLPKVSQIGSYLIDIESTTGKFIDIDKQAKNFWNFWNKLPLRQNFIDKRYEFVKKNCLIDSEFFRRYLVPVGV
jgi:glycosyltransferase involved in cell wall biosynthesis